LLVEALTGALFGVAWWFTLGTGGSLDTSFDVRLFRFVVDAVYVLAMVVITFIDIDTKLILNKITIPAIPLFYVASLALPERRWWDGLVGAAVGYGGPWLIGEIYYRVRKIEGLGLGDGMLLAVVGALCGWRGVVASLFIGSVVGSVVSIPAILIARRSSPDGLMKTELPFGPFLAVGAVFYLFAEPWLLLAFRI
jgi:leader peptidase (prepilin peptidase)/N-methyltransferase